MNGDSWDMISISTSVGTATPAELLSLIFSILFYSKHSTWTMLQTETWTHMSVKSWVFLKTVTRSTRINSLRCFFKLDKLEWEWVSRFRWSDLRLLAADSENAALQVASANVCTSHDPISKSMSESCLCHVCGGVGGITRVCTYALTQCGNGCWRWDHMRWQRW